MKFIWPYHSYLIVLSLQTYVDKPTDINQCHPELKKFYLDIIKKNYVKLGKELPASCFKDTATIKNLLKEMETSSNAMVNAFFDSKDCDPTSEIKDTLANYKDIKSKFTAYGRCGFR